ncbi:MAG: hypothetical protein AVDCRST_MAG64-1436 [uncultured Phycisphaerae bacterium]|uniref:Uncharacterized protein n=1 Tax=uncultured Phycisphaerae bacterium TaxID=904963 RepID=A0A6J4NRK1_9BACT|nr:MAG: hypothetical protein AVDCRST_MAG64-1436 [uncultured Phycisphaerae bacterium]
MLGSRMSSPHSKKDGELIAKVCPATSSGSRRGIYARRGLDRCHTSGLCRALG